MTIEFDVTDSSAEYLRIKISRATSDQEANELRAQLEVLEKELHRLHKEKVKEHGRNNRR